MIQGLGASFGHNEANCGDGVEVRAAESAGDERRRLGKNGEAARVHESEIESAGWSKEVLGALPSSGCRRR